MDQLTHLFDATFSDVEKFKSSNRHDHRQRSTLQSLYTALNRQRQDRLLAQQDFDRMPYVVRELFDLKLQIEAEPS